MKKTTTTKTIISKIYKREQQNSPVIKATPCWQAAVHHNETIDPRPLDVAWRVIDPPRNAERPRHTTTPPIHFLRRPRSRVSKLNRSLSARSASLIAFFILHRYFWHRVLLIHPPTLLASHMHSNCSRTAHTLYLVIADFVLFKGRPPSHHTGWISAAAAAAPTDPRKGRRIDKRLNETQNCYVIKLCTYS